MILLHVSWLQGWVGKYTGSQNYIILCSPLFPQVTTPNIKKKVAEGYHNLLPEWKLLIWSNLCAHNKRSAGKIVWAIHQMREIAFLLQFWNRVLGWGQHVTNQHLITSSQWENLVSSNFRIIDATYTRVYIHQNCGWAQREVWLDYRMCYKLETYPYTLDIFFFVGESSKEMNIGYFLINPPHNHTGPASSGIILRTFRLFPSWETCCVLPNKSKHRGHDPIESWG